jgi:hypothetical protein
MPHHMSTSSRVLRVIGGLALITLALFEIGKPWTWIGIFPLIVGTIGWCPFPVLRARLTEKGDISSERTH